MILRPLYLKTDFTEENQFDLDSDGWRCFEMDGLTAARIIRGMKGTDAGKIPIFAMNASAFANVVEARRAGMNEHLARRRMKRI